MSPRDFVQCLYFAYTWTAAALPCPGNVTHKPHKLGTSIVPLFPAEKKNASNVHNVEMICSAPSLSIFGM
jgi:hypothetical protein